MNKYVEVLKKHLKDRRPDTLMILGSGLGALADGIQERVEIPYSDLGFPQSTVSGHEGRLVIGRLGKHEVICMQGRFHLYEGIDPAVIKDIICAFAGIGVKQMIVTNAAGSLNREMPAGSLMLITDHINFSGRNPLVGPNDDNLGPRFPDMSAAYDLSMRNRFKKLAATKNVPLAEGVYFMVLGPNFETPAEIRAFSLLGADAVGSSTVTEVLAAVYAGMKVLGVSVITNLGTGLQTSAQSHEETLHQASRAAARLAELIKDFMEE